MTYEGQRITAVRPMRQDELEREGWTVAPVHSRPLVIVLENGATLFPSMDPEGNGPGALFGTNTAGEPVYVESKKQD